MKNEDPATNAPKVPPAPLIQLPIALYESNGLIFELYQGGQPYEPVVMRWERLKTVTVTREDNRDHNVNISQGRREAAPDNGHETDRSY